MPSRTGRRQVPAAGPLTTAAAAAAIAAFAALAVPVGLGLSPTPAAAAEGGVIAVVGPMSGPYAAIGTAMRASAEKRAAGVTLRFEDDGCQAATARDVAQRLVTAQVAVVIGHPCSSAAIAAAPVYAAAGIPMISTGARHADVTDKRAGPLVFRLAGRDDRQGQVAADYLARFAGSRPIAILHDRTHAMSTLAAAAASVLTSPLSPPSPPAHQVTQFPFVASEFDYGALADKIAALSPDPAGLGAILFAGYGDEAIVILKALRARGVTAPVILVDAAATTRFGEMLQPKLGEVYTLVSPETLGPDGTVTEPVEGAPRGAQPVARRTAAAIGLWQSVLASAPQEPGSAIAQHAYEDATLGRLAFDSKGDALIPSYVICAWRDGAWRAVAPAAGEPGRPP
jgi:branched-chain amino acid transport system substrate-binding protein